MGRAGRRHTLKLYSIVLDIAVVAEVQVLEYHHTLQYSHYHVSVVPETESVRAPWVGPVVRRHTLKQ